MCLQPETVANPAATCILDIRPQNCHSVMAPVSRQPWEQTPNVIPLFQQVVKLLTTNHGEGRCPRSRSR